MKTTKILDKKSVKRDWYVIDAENKVLGRVASRIANILRGKNKPVFAPSVDTGDFVIVLNADKIVLTGNKLTDKMYHSHSGYPGGLKSVNAQTMLAKKPEEVLRKAVKGMLPKNKLARHMITKLKIYTGSEHPHQAQQPKPIEL